MIASQYSINLQTDLRFMVHPVHLQWCSIGGEFSYRPDSILTVYLKSRWWGFSLIARLGQFVFCSN